MIIQPIIYAHPCVTCVEVSNVFWEGKGITCNECDRVFRNQACYDRHKNEPINGGGRTVCEVIRKCEKCSKPMDVRHIKDGGHICGKKCETCGLILTPRRYRSQMLYKAIGTRGREQL